jgi:hypothetical protein
MTLACNLIFGLLFCFELTNAQDDLREWIDDTGKHKTRAALVKVHEDKVELRLENGQIRMVPIVRLSKADVAYLRNLALQQENPAGPPAAKDQPKKIIKVELDLGQPKITDKNTVHFAGTTNLPAGTTMWIRSDPEKLQVRASVITNDVIVAADGTFKFILNNPYGFKTGKHRVELIVDVYRHIVGIPLFGPGDFEPKRSQSPEFYLLAGSFGQNLRGPLVVRENMSGFIPGYLGERKVEVNVVGEYELSDKTSDEVARLEKRLLKKCSRAIGDAFKMHERMIDQGIYTSEHVFYYSQHLENLDVSVRSVRSLEAFFQLKQAVDALRRINYYSTPVAAPSDQKFAQEYAQAVTDYKTAKAKLDAFIKGIK